MKRDLLSHTGEPVGIVISGNREAPQAPRFSAYVWAPAPEDTIELDAQPA